MIAKKLSSAISASRAASDRLIDAIEELKTRLITRYEREFPGQISLVHEAIEEAEFLAWATPFPHLFLPDFAEIRITNLTRQAAPMRDKRCVSLALAA
ncbi:hypothetical protein BH09VER1_BH09VER1_08740 [soil metagenome]